MTNQAQTEAVATPGQRVFAIVVAYFPTAGKFVPLVESLCRQACGVIVVDNTPSDGAEVTGMLHSIRSRFPELQLVTLGENRGIGAAQNIGMRLAAEHGCDYVLLSDQDSSPDEGMVAALLATAHELQTSGITVGCVCPAYFDEITGQPFSFQVQPPGRMFYGTLAGDRAMPWVEIVTAISSGSLIPVASVQKIGDMREDFFIDHVDIEWCHRARALGFHNFGTTRARLRHSLGDAPFRVWCFGWREMSEYSPTRLYYRFRNFVLMARLPHVPFLWSVRASGYWLLSMYAHCFFAAHRWSNTKAIARGLRDGLLGRAGRMPGR